MGEKAAVHGKTRIRILGTARIQQPSRPMERRKIHLRF
jgi:hypothetical protein